MNYQRDIVKKAEGDVDPTVVVTPKATDKRFSLAPTTDKMGITSGGKLVRAFWWGLVFGAGIIVGIGLWKNKINISYTK